MTFFVIKGFCRNGTSGNQESRLKIHLVSSGVALDGLESRLGSKASYIVAKHGAMRTHISACETVDIHAGLSTVP